MLYLPCNDFPVYPKCEALAADCLPVECLRFTHHSIRPVFRAGDHCGRSLYDLVNDLWSQKVCPLRSLPPLEVVWYDGAWRSLSNRRLWCLKAYMGLAGLGHLMVRVRFRQRLPPDFAEKNSTYDEGLTVQVTGDEDALRTTFRETRRVCRYFSSPIGCPRGISCPFAHVEKEDTRLKRSSVLEVSRILLRHAYACASKRVAVVEDARETLDCLPASCGSDWTKHVEAALAACENASKHQEPKMASHASDEHVFANREPVEDAIKFTTVMLKNLPDTCTYELLVNSLHERFQDQVDLVYLPIRFKKQCNKGYAFINFRSALSCKIFVDSFNGIEACRLLREVGVNSDKAVQVVPARIQGFHDNVQHLCNSAVMQELIRYPNWMPRVFDACGRNQAFPYPRQRALSSEEIFSASSTVSTMEADEFCMRANIDSKNCETSYFQFEAELSGTNFTTSEGTDKSDNRDVEGAAEDECVLDSQEGAADTKNAGLHDVVNDTNLHALRPDVETNSLPSERSQRLYLPLGSKWVKPPNIQSSTATKTVSPARLATENSQAKNYTVLRPKFAQRVLFGKTGEQNHADQEEDIPKAAQEIIPISILDRKIAVDDHASAVEDLGVEQRLVGERDTAEDEVQIDQDHVVGKSGSANEVVDALSNAHVQSHMVQPNGNKHNRAKQAELYQAADDNLACSDSSDTCTGNDELVDIEGLNSQSKQTNQHEMKQKRKSMKTQVVAEHALHEIAEVGVLNEIQPSAQAERLDEQRCEESGGTPHDASIPQEECEDSLYTEEFDRQHSRRKQQSKKQKRKNRKIEMAAQQKRDFDDIAEFAVLPESQPIIRADKLDKEGAMLVSARLGGSHINCCVLCERAIHRATLASTLGVCKQHFHDLLHEERKFRKQLNQPSVADLWERGRKGSVCQRIAVMLNASSDDAEWPLNFIIFGIQRKYDIHRSQSFLKLFLKLLISRGFQMDGKRISTALLCAFATCISFAPHFAHAFASVAFASLEKDELVGCFLSFAQLVMQDWSPTRITELFRSESFVKVNRMIWDRLSASRESAITKIAFDFLRLYGESWNIAGEGTIAVPIAMRVTCSSDVSSCTGDYELSEELVNGLPMWRHRTECRFLFFGTDAKWYIGDEDEEDSNFEIRNGYVWNDMQNIVDVDKNKKVSMPHEIDGHWKQHSAENDEAVISELIVQACCMRMSYLQPVPVVYLGSVEEEEYCADWCIPASQISRFLLRSRRSPSFSLGTFDDVHLIYEPPRKVDEESDGETCGLFIAISHPGTFTIALTCGTTSKTFTHDFVSSKDKDWGWHSFWKLESLLPQKDLVLSAEFIRFSDTQTNYKR